jgi:hypothetical protein
VQSRALDSGKFIYLFLCCACTQLDDDDSQQPPVTDVHFRVMRVAA